jgi:hypothetical protein
MGKSQWQQLYDFLKSKNFNVFSPMQPIGECKQKYIVIKYAGSTRHMFCSTDVDIYTIFCYVPKDKYSILEGYVQDVKKAMKDIYPQFIPTGLQTASFYEEEIKAHMVSLDYKNYKKI